MTRRIEPAKLKSMVGTMYPSPFDQPCRTRERCKLGDAADLMQFGVNLMTLPPGSWSSQRHWHSREDEFVYVLEGEVVLVTDAGEETLGPGDCAGFKAGAADGHCLQNRSSRVALVLEVGARDPADETTYPGIDLRMPPHGQPTLFTHRDGTAYENLRLRGPED